MPTACLTHVSSDKKRRRVTTVRPSRVESDEELVLQYAETGDRQMFEEIVRRFEREIYRYLCTYLGDAQLAEDAFQTTLLQLHLKCRQFEAGRKLRPWLYTIANHQAADLLRRNRRHKSVSLNAPAAESDSEDERNSLDNILKAADGDPVSEVESAEDRQRTRAAVERLPAKLRDVLLLVAYQGLKYREAAEVLRVPLGTVKSRLNLAMQSLHETLVGSRQAKRGDASQAIIFCRVRS